ncbi:M28 family peptidase [Flavobacteriaceae bacterium SZ-1-7]|uniref:M28 family peptidase n=1 Tax=Tamlana sedimenti TaxID=3134126 RepID=UPI0031207C4D
MNRTIYLLIIYFFLSCVNIKAQTIESIDLKKDSLFSKTKLLKHIQALSSDAFEGRRTGSNGAVKARSYIVNQFYTLGVSPFYKQYERPFSFSNENKRYSGANILGFIKGTEFPDKYMVISAHYDHEGVKKGMIYNGADDNASGVAALFSFAEYFKSHSPKHSIVLAAFDAEELGLNGSKYFLNNLKIKLSQIKVNLNMDMISRSDENELFAVGTKHHQFLKKIILNTKGSGKLKLKIGHEDGDWKDNWTYSSDHANFYKKRIPFLYFGVPDHKDYHEPTDDFENIHPDFYIDAVKTIISVFEKLDAMTL